jgi:hypothetical protein
MVLVLIDKSHRHIAYINDISVKKRLYPINSLFPFHGNNVWRTQRPFFYFYQGEVIKQKKHSLIPLITIILMSTI